MSDTCPTVKVKSGDGHIVINASDFDPSVHEVFEAPPPPPPGAPPPPPGPADPLDNLPENWRDEHGTRLKSLAAAVSDGRAVENKQQAIEVIEAALKAAGK